MIIGLMGLMGSGKSTVAEYLKSKNMPVIDLDVLSHNVYDYGTDEYYKILEIWGNDILDEGSQIDRSKLSKKVFSNSYESISIADLKRSGLENLELIVWPKLEELLTIELNSHKSEELLFIEGAQIVKSGFNRYCDKLWCIVSSIENIKSRLDYRHVNILGRLKIQIEDYAKLNNIDEFIYNDSTKQELNNNVQFLLERIRKET